MAEDPVMQGNSAGHRAAQGRVQAVIDSSLYSTESFAVQWKWNPAL